MAQLRFTQPSVFATGLVGNVIENAATPSDDACHLIGGGTLSWLLRFDLAAGTLLTGGAKPAAQATGPYSFVDEVVGAVHVQPVNLAAPLSSTCAFDSAPGDLMLPIYLDSSATQTVFLPLQSLRLHGSLSADHGCIGRYNAEALDPANACFPDSATPAFQDGGSLDAFITLEAADQITVSSLSQTLCVLLSGNPAQYGVPGPNGTTVCKRTNGVIVFQGDWCAALDQPANPMCADAVRVAATFAAQGVKLQ